MAKHWIQGAINPKHKGFCTPMSKSTCTGRRRALALTFKKHHGFHEQGGYVYGPNAPYGDGGLTYGDGGAPSALRTDNTGTAFYFDPNIQGYVPVQQYSTNTPQFNYTHADQPLGPPTPYSPGPYDTMTPATRRPQGTAYGNMPAGSELPDNLSVPASQSYSRPAIAGSKTPGGRGFNWNQAMEYAAPAYNLGMGLFSKVDKYTPKTVNQVGYHDTNFNKEPFRRAAAATTADIRNLYGATGGAGANAAMMANRGNIASKEWEAQNQISNENQRARMGVDATNANIQYQNANLDLSAYGLNRENRAAKQQMLATGIGQLGQIGAHNQDEENASKVFADYLGSNWATILRNQKNG